MFEFNFGEANPYFSFMHVLYFGGQRTETTFCLVRRTSFVSRAEDVPLAHNRGPFSLGMDMTACEYVARWLKDEWRTRNGHKFPWAEDKWKIREMEAGKDMPKQVRLYERDE